jgi:hypothetical protein
VKDSQGHGRVDEVKGTGSGWKLPETEGVLKDWLEGCENERS